MVYKQLIGIVHVNTIIEFFYRKIKIFKPLSRKSLGFIFEMVVKSSNVCNKKIEFVTIFLFLFKVAHFKESS